MNQKGIAYKEVDIDQPDGKMAFVQAGGSGGIPLLVAGGQKLRGFKTEAYDAFFAARRGPSWFAGAGRGATKEVWRGKISGFKL
jgi:hypothetical protein